MTRHPLAIGSLLLGACIVTPAARATAQYVVRSPDGKIAVAVRHERAALTFSISNGKTVLIDRGALALMTSRGDFGDGLRFVRQSRTVIDETYTLPVGKRSTYVNRANELDLAFAKGAQELHVVLRAYDDGVAFRYALPGAGEVEITGETTTFPLAGADVAY